MSNKATIPAAEPDHTLNFSQLERQILAHGAESIFQSARRNGVRIVGACGGRGSCGTCVVHIVEGEVEHSQVAERDADSAEAQPGKKKWVQACLVSARSDCTIEVAPRSLAPIVRAEMESGAAETLVLDPAVVSRDLTLPAATLTDNMSDADRLARALGTPLDIDFAVARQLPKALRDGKWSLRARLRGHELIGTASLGRRTLGLAVDLGTTNAAAFLIDLESGIRLASLGIENPQVAWGADLITRINAAVKSAAAEELRGAGLAAINALAHDLCHAVGAARDDIVDVVVCGNTAMHHLLLGLPVSQLGRAPFVAALRAGVDLKAREVGIGTCPGAYVHMVPNVGGFVGGDHVAALVATEERWQGAGTSLVMDIGTNTEISLIHHGEFLTTSAPSGPALEGSHISCGMRAAEGAIERVRLTEAGRIAVEVIGDTEEAVGLCGSGVLDAVATLHRAGIIDDRGRLCAEHADVGEINGMRAAILAPGVYFTQHDVRAVQLAKAAIRTAVEMLLQQAGLQQNDIERFIIAGAFGAYIDVDSGIATGLFPDLPRDRFAQVGNAAGVGVRQMLASKQARARAEVLANRCRYIELSTISEFQKCFLKNIGFQSNTSTRKVA